MNVNKRHVKKKSVYGLVFASQYEQTFQGPPLKVQIEFLHLLPLHLLLLLLLFLLVLYLVKYLLSINIIYLLLKILFFKDIIFWIIYCSLCNVLWYILWVVISIIIIVIVSISIIIIGGVRWIMVMRVILLRRVLLIITQPRGVIMLIIRRALTTIRRVLIGPHGKVHYSLTNKCELNLLALSLHLLVLNFLRRFVCVRNAAQRVGSSKEGKGGAI